MEFFRIKPVSETEIDQIVAQAGGRRLLTQESADYELNEALIE